MRDDSMQHDHGSTGGLARLDELDDFKVASGYPDPRGWPVKTRDGRTIGEVKNLLVDRDALRVRYLDLELDDEFRSAGAANGRVHVPVASAHLDDDRDEVLVDLDAAGLGTLGVADVDRFDAGDARHDDSRFFGNRVASDRAGAAYVTLHEEQLAVGKRRVQAGEVEVRKNVEVEHVRENVALRHDEVSSERRPLDADDAARLGRTPTIDADGETIRVPLMAEEAVVEKRVVPVEEVVIRTETHTEEQLVEDTLRRERVDIDRRMHGTDATIDRGGTPGLDAQR